LPGSIFAFVAVIILTFPFTRPSEARTGHPGFTTSTCF
jgi:hypothetical protein